MNTQNRFFIYARKSTDVEDKQVRSIESQLDELREFAAQNGVCVVAEFTEKQSAKAPGRPIFNDMLARLEQGEATGVLSWHPDRLARNSVDGGKVIWLVDTNVLQTLKFPTFWFENTPQGKFMLSMAFGQSKYYVDALSENTKRGIRAKVRRGEFPHMAPIGYLNDPRLKRIIIDQERAPLVKETFERYASGKETFDTLRAWLASKGIRSASGKIAGRNFISKVLSNPIYYGHFKHGGEVHEGIHEPIISKQLFDEVQTLVNRRYRWSPTVHVRTPKPFVGLLRCATCGCAVTAEIQKGHTYYRCTRKSKAVDCSQPYVREETLDASISGLLSPFAMRMDFADALLARMETEKKSAAESARAIAREKDAEVAKLNARLERLKEGFLDGIFDRETFLPEKAKLMSQKKTLEEQSERLATQGNQWLEPMKKWILEAKSLGSVTATGALTEKKTLASKVFGSNLVLDCKKAGGRAVYPWAFCADNELTSQLAEREGFEPSDGI
jgi:site-specific DNA recombinase